MWLRMHLPLPEPHELQLNLSGGGLLLGEEGHTVMRPSARHAQKIYLGGAKRILQKKSLARHWARDWLALALTQVHQKKRAALG